MTLPKKGLRKITVDGAQYAWNTTGNDGWVSLSVAPLNGETLLTATFGYHEREASRNVDKDGRRSISIKPSISITSYIVRQIILLGLSRGWDPERKAPQINLGSVDHLIDLRLPSEEEAGRHYDRETSAWLLGSTDEQSLS